MYCTRCIRNISNDTIKGEFRNLQIYANTVLRTQMRTNKFISVYFSISTYIVIMIFTISTRIVCSQYLYMN